MAEIDPVIRIHPADDVVIARHQLLGGTHIASEGLTVSGLIPPGHKIAVRAIAAGQPVRRYNQIIGSATRDIAAGQHVHSHNLAFSRFERGYAVGGDVRPTAYVETPATFEGIVRADGRVATRNYIGVLTSVNCSATVARAIADHFRRDIHPEALAAFPNVDGIVALTHGAGCATDSEGEGLRVLRRTLAGYARHANFAAVIVVGLGCETNQIQGLLAQEGLREGAKLVTFSIQDSGGTAKSVARGVDAVLQLLPEANAVKREPVSAKHLIVGLQCGGSDGYSGISANPALGAAVDLVVRHGGTVMTVTKGIDLIKAMLPTVNQAQRVPCGLEHIIVGLQCGGSDGYSGISANPALGAAVDLLVAHGGTAILSETPEIYGAEHLLTRRAVRREVGEKLVERIRWWEHYTAMHQGEMNNNPSPGNKAGGLTTILEKSLGAVAKAGTSNLQAVYEYAEKVTARGLVYMDTPGYDPVSATGQVAGGANIICFTTGRGSAYGCAPSPSLKLATNSALWQRQSADIDINCGDVVDGGSTVQAKGEEIFQRIVSCASGASSKSELYGYGQNEFVPWQVGAVM